jgi:hypothetical protein
VTWKDWAEAFEKAKAETGATSTILKGQNRAEIDDLLKELQRLTDRDSTEQ